jgi:hypothetical protein
MTKNKIKIAVLPTGDWAEIVNGEDVYYIYPDKKTFLALCNDEIDIDDAAYIADGEKTLKEVLEGR